MVSRSKWSHAGGEGFVAMLAPGDVVDVVLKPVASLSRLKDRKQ
jgi:hypothetical protein